MGKGNLFFMALCMLPLLNSCKGRQDEQRLLESIEQTWQQCETALSEARMQAEVLKDESTHLVFVTTRHDMHAAQIKAALDAGKYVFSEKPLCINEEQLEKLFDLRFSDCVIGNGGAPNQTIKQSNNQTILNRVMIGFNRRFSPHAKLLKEYFAKRTLPLVMHYRVNAGSIPKDIWLQDPEVGGGRMVGEGCHFIDFMSYICGAPVEKVQAMCIKTANGAETPEDSISVNLQFADGSVGTLEYVALGDTTLPKEFCEIHGEGSTATMDNFCKTVCSGKLGKPAEGIQGGVGGNCRGGEEREGNADSV